MRTLILVAVTALAAGCATPRIITSITSNNDQMKLVYARTGTLETGVIQCTIGPDGALSGCRKIPVHFSEE